MIRAMRIIGGLLLLAALVLFVGEAQSAQAQASLYDRLGKTEAITAVVDEFVANVAGDARINKFFAKTDIPRLKKLLVEQICQATGGPCQYSGRSMKETHKGMGVSDADFNALVEDLVKALDKFKVPDKEKNELLGILGPLKSDIVEVPSGLPKTGADSASDFWPAALLFVAGLGLIGASFIWRKGVTR